MNDQLLLVLLFLAIVVMAGYYYWQRARSRGSSVTDHDDPAAPR